MTDDFGYSQRAMKVAADCAGASIPQLMFDWRNRPLVYARWAVMHCLRKRGATIGMIAWRLGRDRATVRYGLAQVEFQSARNPILAEMLFRVDAA